MRRGAFGFSGSAFCFGVFLGMLVQGLGPSQGFRLNRRTQTDKEASVFCYVGIRTHDPSGKAPEDIAF